METMSPAGNSTAAVGIICKTPKVGASKTRLVPLLGAEGAAELAAAFLRDVAAAIEAVPASERRRGYAVYAPAGTENELIPLLPSSFGMLCRRGATLETVLLGATQELLLAGHDCVILVNGDSPTLPPVTISEAMAALRRPGDRAVFGPASDGGYYLIGLKYPHAELFRNIPWSTQDTLAVTLERARALELESTLLPMWYDIDDEETLRLLIAEIAELPLPFDHGTLKAGRAEATRAFMAARPDLIGRCVCHATQGFGQ